MVDVAQQEQSRWKAKYLDALDTCEQLEKTAGGRVNELGALVARLARGLPGPAAGDASKRLGKLTDALKRKPLDARLSRDLKDANARVIDVIEAQDREHGDVMAALVQAAAQLEQHCSNRAFKRRLKQFRSSLGRREAPPTSELLISLRALQQDVFDSVQSGTGAHHTAGGEDAQQVPANDGQGKAAIASAAAVIEPEPEPEPESFAARSVAQNEPMPTAGSLPKTAIEANDALSVERIDRSAIREVLAAIVRQAELPAPFKKRAEAITSQLDRDLGDEQLLSVLEQIRDLFDGALAAMDAEFRGFLDSVDQRLDGLLATLGQAHKEEQAAMSRERGFTDSFTASLKAMRNEAAAATDLSDLKHSIDGHLESLVRSVKDISNESRATGSERDTRLAAMSARLHELEAESAQARTQLETQRQLARTDSLTRLSNRKAFDERIAQEIEAAQRSGAPLAIAIADIDHFKHVNDTWGHAAGDRALALFARILESRTRSTDFCARFGGEEFVMVFSDTRSDVAAGVVEQVREFVENCGFSYKGEPVALTASFGITQHRHGDSAQSMLERADKAMYEAKSGGRNQVRLSAD